MMVSCWASWYARSRCKGGATIVVAATPPVGLIYYNANLLNPYPGTPGAQDADFACTAVVDGAPEGSSIVYSWVNKYTPPGPGNNNGGWLAVEDPGNSQSATAHAYGPGTFTVGCQATITPPGGQPWLPIESSVTVFAIGGPLTPSVAPGSVVTLLHDKPDSDPPSSNYLQYFSYDPTAQHNPAGAELPQYGRPDSTPGQPSGTTYAWTLAGSLSLDPNSTLTSSSILFAASARSGFGADGATCTYTLTIGGVTYPVADDSAQTPVVKADKVTYALDPPFYKFTAHIPVNATSALQPGGLTHNFANGVYSVNGMYNVTVTDNLGQAMPFVWVQERFPEGVPLLNWTVNTNGVPWVTKANGVFVDSIGTSQTFAWTYATHQNLPLFSFYHDYWGATNQTVLNAFGIFLKEYTDKIWTDNVIRQ